MMLRAKTALLTTAAMFAFAANSILCRLALKTDSIDPNSFTWIRLASGACMLMLLMHLHTDTASNTVRVPHSWISALALLAYALGFSWAYSGLASATGALLLFGAVQMSMIGYGLFRGEKPTTRQWLGIAMACGGLVWILLPGASAPNLQDAVLMLMAGAAWGVYSLRGKSSINPVATNRNNFQGAALLTFPMFGLTLVPEYFPDWLNNPLTIHFSSHWSVAGIALAVASGTLASGLGYAIWYAALPGLKATQAATVQLSVPVITAVFGALLLDEWLSLGQVLACAVVLIGIALVQMSKR